MTRWTLKPQADQAISTRLQKEINVSKPIADLLVQRGIHNFEEAKAFFRPQIEQLHDPFLMKDMDKAVLRIEQALEKGERIMVYGDYDVDGTTSVALMSSYLKNIYPDIVSYIPDRYDEGYGISYKGIDFASDNGISLIIALDCGIKAIDKINYAKEQSIDFIICDHHLPGAEIPDALAVLDPKRNDCNYPYKELCGCGVGFKLIQGLQQSKSAPFEELFPYLDLVATAIAADIVPIDGENRILTYYGLKRINTQPRIGLKALINLANKKKDLTVTDVVFTIAPRINAAGRMKHGLHAVEILTETDEDMATNFAKSIENYNTDRKATDKKITEEALDQIQQANEEDRYTTVVYQENWHKGVIGIVASRLTETYYRPTVVFTKSGDKLAASVRSVTGFDVYGALEACSDTIEQFGGHKYAAGLTLKEENYLKFKEKFELVVRKQIDPKLLQAEILIDREIQLSQITSKFHAVLKQFSPFGPSNRSPIFMTKDIADTGYAKKVGADQTHLKCTFSNGEQAFGAIGFNLGSKVNLIKEQQPVKAVYAIEENEWNGNVSIQMRIKDIETL